MIKKLLVVCTVLMFSGCATTVKGPFFTKAPAAPYKKATVYIFSAPYVWGSSPTVKVDGKPIGKLHSGGYFYVYMSPGIHQLSFHVALQNQFITEIDVQEGQEHYIEYYLTGYEQGIREIPKEQAIDYVKDYKFVKPF